LFGSGGLVILGWGGSVVGGMYLGGWESLGMLFRFPVPGDDLAFPFLTVPPSLRDWGNVGMSTAERVIPAWERVRVGGVIGFDIPVTFP
jgi:hypothetical protein